MQAASLSTARENHERRKSDDSCGNFLIPSVLIAVFEGGVFGAAALVFSVLTSAALQTGETEKAKVYSRRTTLFCWIGLATGIVKIALYILCLAASQTNTVVIRYERHMAVGIIAMRDKASLLLLFIWNFNDTLSASRLLFALFCLLWK